MSGLQRRSPLFDQRVVELSREIPPQYKLTGAQEKAVLKFAVADILPAFIIKRPKSGMILQMSQWFHTIWRKQARDLLLNKNAAIASYFNQVAIREWIDYRGDQWSRRRRLISPHIQTTRRLSMDKQIVR